MSLMRCFPGGLLPLSLSWVRPLYLRWCIFALLSFSSDCIASYLNALLRTYFPSWGENSQIFGMMYHGVKHVLRKILGLIYHRWHQHVRHQNPCNVCPFNVGHLAMHKMQRMHLWKRYIYYVTFVMQNAVVQNATIFFFSRLVSAPIIF